MLKPETLVCGVNDHSVGSVIHCKWLVAGDRVALIPRRGCTTHPVCQLKTERRSKAVAAYTHSVARHPTPVRLPKISSPLTAGGELSF